MQHTEWIVVADGGRARIFSHDYPQPDVELTLLHEMTADSRRSRDVGSDRPGRSYESVGETRHAIAPHTDPHRHLQQVFATEMVEYLTEKYRAEKFRTLVLVAAPRTLGDLREQLTPDLSATVRAELNKDLTKATPEEVARHITDLAGV